MRTRLNAALLVFGLVCGCFSCSVGPKLADVGRPCSTDDECFDAEVCVEDLCSSRSRSTAILVAEFIPASGLPEWSCNPAVDECHDLASTHQLNHRFAPVDVVRGTVISLDGEVEVRVPARVVFSRRSPLPGRPGVDVATESGLLVDEAGATWSVSLPRGAYDVRVRATDPVQRVPPFELSGIQTFDPDDPGARLDLVTPVQVEVRGRVVRPDGSGVEGVTVVAHAGDDTRAVSTTGTTGACEGGTEVGCFVVYVAEDQHDIALRISPVEGGPIVPMVFFPPRSIVPGKIAHDLGDLMLDSYGPPITFSGLVEGPLPEGGTAALAGASLLFRSTRLGVPDGPDLRGNAERVVTAGIDGTFEAVLLAGEYDVRVVPPGDGYAEGLAVWTGRQLVNDTDGDFMQAGQTYTLGPAVRFSGVLVTSGVADADTSSVPIDALGGAQLWSAPGAFTEESANRSIFSATQSGGRFELALDPGHYDVLFRTPQGSEASWIVMPSMYVEAGSDVSDQTILLTGGSVLVGNVTGPGAEGVAGVVVRFYAVRDGGSVQVGEATTDSNGNYLAFLPVDP